MSDHRGYVLIDVLMEGVSVVGVLAMLAIGTLQVGKAATGIYERTREARYDVLRRDLEELSARQVIHFADELTYSSSPTALRYEASAGVAVRIVATGWGWAAAATHSRLDDDEGCAIYSGHVPPLEAPVTPAESGEVACTD
jgi:hypothetical protein